MGLDNCAACGKVFNRSVRDICTPCSEAEQRWLERILAVVEAAPDASATVIAAEAEVSRDDLVRLLRRGWLNGYDRLKKLLKCDRCTDADEVSQGALCKKCSTVVQALVTDLRADLGELDKTKQKSDPKKQLSENRPQGHHDPTTTSRSDYWRNRVQR